jgi:hypothetical protein
MTKVVLQPGLRALSGAMGDWVFQTRNGKTIVGMKPLKSKEPTQAQIDHRDRFKQAAAYAKRTLADSNTRKIYDLVSEEKNIPAMALCVADFFHAPSIELMDFGNYNGQIGSSIQILTADDIGVVSLKVTLRDGQGTLIESGDGVEYPLGTGQWTYTAKSAVASGTSVTAYVTATDRPGGMATQNAVTTTG